jgi:hypothetical protein
MYGSVVVAGIGEWSMTGYVPGVVDDTAFGDTVMKWNNAGIADAGEVSFSGNYDPADTTGQVALLALAESFAHTLLLTIVVILFQFSRSLH